MQLAHWFYVLPAVQNGWTFAAFLVLLTVWVVHHRR
jgi:hypothetical protein